MKSPIAPFVLFASLLCTATIDAQTPSPRAERPYRGLFGGGVGDTEQSLTVNLSLAGGYDDNVLGDQGTEGGVATSSTDPRSGGSGTYGQLAGGLNYSLNRTRLSFGASFGASTRYYSDVIDDLVGAYSGTLGATVRLSSGQSLTASQSVSYRPFLQLALFPQLFDLPVGETVMPSLDLVTSREEYFSYNSTAEYTAAIGRRGSFQVGYGRQFSDLDSVERDLTTQDARVRYTHQLTQGLGLRFGYGFREGSYPTASESRAITWQSWDVGLDYSRALSFSRRTTLSFATGSSAIGDQERTYYRVTGDARLNHEIGRSWNALLAYSRGVGFVESFAEPFFSDSLTASFGGMMSRRLDFRSAAGASVGSVGLTGGHDFNTYFATTNLTYGLTRYLGIGTEYFYYRYHFDAAALLPAGMSRELDRHGVRAYLSLWAPLIHRGRRPDAPR